MNWAMICALLLIFSVTGADVWTLYSHLQAADATQHAMVVLDRTRELLARLDDAETGQRGYLLTGDATYLQPFDFAKPDVQELINELKTLTADDAAQRPRLDALEAMVIRKFAELDRTIAMRREQGSEAAAAVVRENYGRNIMAQIRTLIATMEADEKGRIAERNAKLKLSSGHAMQAAVLGDLAALSLLLGAGLVTRREMRARARADAKLRELVQQLTRSNRDLEQFAYVASHDLQEPLRMVANYCQLLQQRYKDRLGSDANDFIGFAVDGARRMQTLINDLLAFSRIGTNSRKLGTIDANACLGAAVKNLDAAIAASKALITHDRLPAVVADETEIIQVFQNLIGNSIKFRRETPPLIHVSAQPDGADWRFGVRDNGIGIAPEYRDQIFAIFRRLHPPDEYPGTGIGLAICKKIVERYGGRIWIESVVGAGSTFYFTLPQHPSSVL